jgi:hypothetical protein
LARFLCNRSQCAAALWRKNPRLADAVLALSIRQRITRVLATWPASAVACGSVNGRACGKHRPAAGTQLPATRASGWSTSKPIEAAKVDAAWSVLMPPNITHLCKQRACAWQ